MIAIYRYEKINYELNRLRSALNEAQIPFIPLKGSVLRQYYPEPWMRTSSYWCMRAILNVILQHLSINWHISRNQKVLMILVCFRTPVFILNCTFAFSHFNEFMSRRSAPNRLWFGAMYYCKPQIIPRLSSIFPKWYNEVQSTATRCN